MGTIQGPDFLFLLIGFFWLIAGAVTESHGQAVDNRRAWRCFSVFALSYALLSWCKMLVLGVGDQPAFSALRIALLLLSICSLVEFSRSVLLRHAAVRRVNGLIYFPVLGAAAAMAAGANLDAATALHSTSLPAGLLLAAISACILAAQHSGRARSRAYVVAAGLFASGVVYSGYVPADAYHFSSEQLKDIALPGTGLLVARIAAAALVSLGLVLGFNATYLRVIFGESRTRLLRREVSWAGSLLAVVVLGGFGTAWMERREETEMRETVIQRIRTVLPSIDAEAVSRLTGDSRDLSLPEYQKIKSLLKALVRFNSDIRFAMLMNVRAEGARFLVDSEDETSGDYSPPGQPYDEAPDEYLAAIRRGSPFVMGPINDRWGSWVSGSHPLPLQDPNFGYVCLDFDFNASDWQARLLQARVPPLLITLLVTSLLLTSFRAQWRLRERAIELVAAEQRSSRLVEGSPNCVLMLDCNGRALTINGSGILALGRQRSDVVGQRFPELWPAAARAELDNGIRRTLRGTPSSFEAEYVRPDGAPTTFQVTLGEIDGVQADDSHLVCICVDITARKRFEREVFAAKDAAEAGLKAKSEFLAVMSHEIRTPLGGVIGMLGLLRKLPQTPQQKHYTSLAHDSAEKLLKILDDVLDAAKIDAGHLSMERLTFDLRAELNPLVESMRFRALEKGLEFHCSYTADVPTLAKGDPTRLRQIVANLLNNALKFTLRGSVRIEFDCTRAGDGRLRFQAAISDTGEGISPEHQARLFAKFEQADASTTRRFGGTGLGLAITKHLVERMDGDIAVHSRQGSGTTFTFHVLLHQPAEGEVPLAEQDTSAQSLPRHSRRLRVLCVDDERVNRVVAEGMLTELGHVVEVAENGERAIERLTLEDFDVVLMDNRMPVMDGLETTRRIRGPESTVRDPQVYIIAASANASATQPGACQNAGMNAFIGKPMRERELHAVLRQAIEAITARKPSLPVMPRSNVSPPVLVPAPNPGLSESELLAQFDAAAASAPGPTTSAAASAKVMVHYLQDAPVRVSQIREALQKEDYPALAIAAHSLKSLSLYVAASRLSDLARDAEALADSGASAELPEIVSALETEFSSVRARLETRTPALIR